MKKTYNNSQMTVFENRNNPEGKMTFSPGNGGDCRVEIDQDNIRYAYGDTGDEVVYEGEYSEGAFRLKATKRERGGVAVLCRATDNLLVGTWEVGTHGGLWQIELRE